MFIEFNDCIINISNINYIKKNAESFFIYFKGTNDGLCITDKGYKIISKILNDNHLILEETIKKENESTDISSKEIQW